MVFPFTLLSPTCCQNYRIAIFWPLSSARLALPIACFQTVHRPLLSNDLHNVRVFGMEFLLYGAILLAVLTGRWLVHKKQFME